MMEPSSDDRRRSQADCLAAGRSETRSGQHDRAASSEGVGFVCFVSVSVSAFFLLRRPLRGSQNISEKDFLPPPPLRPRPLPLPLPLTRVSPLHRQTFFSLSNLAAAES